MKAFVFGEILWDLYTDSKYIGGAPLNFAAHFTKCSGEAYMGSAVGYDELGAETLDIVTTFGINDKYIKKNDKPTGKCIVTLNKDKLPEYSISENTAYDYIDTSDIFEKHFDLLYFGTLALRSEYNKDSLKRLIARNTFDEVFVDINLRKPFISAENIKFALENATILKVSDEELPTAARLIGISSASEKSVAETLAEQFPQLKLIIVTLGADGSFAYISKEKKFVSCCAKKVDAVSTVGAGDSFSAAFTAKYLQNTPVSDCLEFASKISAFVISNKATVPTYNANTVY